MSEENLSIKAKEALRHIRNWIMHNSRFPSMRELMTAMGYKSPRSAMLLLEELETNGFLKKKIDGSYKLIKDLEETETVRTVSIPLIGSVAAGTPIFADENIEAMIPVSTSLIKSGQKYFLLKVRGDSMDLAGINHGDMILVMQKKYADNGENIVALIDDEATVKEFHHSGQIVTLVPRSSNLTHQPIIVTSNLRIQGIVAAVIPKVNN
ncbi:repressor LexA [Lacibacter luteus]|uniref:Repressor LexA n=1 Tax=Lacibacter luteus TaxID=2508719 RepID=A0A4Q1CGM6_9BACT|nr:transcriptional repressor LexA [Lacibacter luteus]RXK59203.1 repressor LexA [Lacibacter luteus]